MIKNSKVFKRRIARYRKKVPLSKTVGNSINIRCELFDTVRAEPLATGFSFSSTANGNRFKNVKEIILNSQTYLKFAPLYGKLRINSVKITVSPVNNLLSISNQIGTLPYTAFAFYPNFTSTNVDTSATPAHDTSLIFDPAQSRFQSKIWRTQKNFYEGQNGTGYGVEFDPGYLTSLSGQISLINIFNLSGSPALQYVVFNVIFVINITLSDQIW